MALTLDEANRVMKATTDKAKELNINISVAVVDSGARLMAFNRMENAAWGGIYGAQGKAAGSAAFRVPSGKLDATRTIIQGIVSAEGDNIIPAQGAVPIFRNGILEGACGVGGGTSAQDEECAQAGADAL